MLSIIVLILTCMLNLVWAQFENIKQKDIVEYNGQSLQFTEAESGYECDWYKAFSFCNQWQHSNLVTIDSAEKETFIVENMDRLSLTQAWIALKNDYPESLNELEVSGRAPINWYWISNDTYTQLHTGYQNWCIDFPKPTSGDSGDELCASLSATYKCWNSSDCIWKKNELAAWICEYRSPPIKPTTDVTSIDEVKADGRTYHFYNGVHMKWTEARDKCATNVQTLAIFDTEEKFKVLKKEMETRRTNYWIGLKLDDDTKIWKWLASETRQFHKNWCTPDDAKMGKNDNCAFVTANDSYSCWQNWHCNSAEGLINGFICESG